MTAALPEHARGKPLELWWQDEARVGQQGTTMRLWAKRGSLPAPPKDCRYAWAYLFGAVCPARGVGAGLVLPHANAQAMNLHLAEISGEVAPSAHALLVLDGAGWHQTGSELRVLSNITLLHLPPYSPELNPVENVWAFLRSTSSATASSTPTTTSSTPATTHGTGSSPNPNASPPSLHATAHRSADDTGGIIVRPSGIGFDELRRPAGHHRAWPRRRFGVPAASAVLP